MWPVHIHFAHLGEQRTAISFTDKQSVIIESAVSGDMGGNLLQAEVGRGGGGGVRRDGDVYCGGEIGLVGLFEHRLLCLDVCVSMWDMNKKPSTTVMSYSVFTLSNYGHSPLQFPLQQGTISGRG